MSNDEHIQRQQTAFSFEVVPVCPELSHIGVREALNSLESWACGPTLHILGDSGWQ